MAPVRQSKKGGKAGKRHVIDASGPAGDKVFDTDAFEKFLTDRIKREGRTGNLGDHITVKKIAGEEGKVEILSTDLSGRYLKYLTKKFLKKHQLRDWLRVVSDHKGTYTVKFFNVHVDQDAEDDDE